MVVLAAGVVGYYWFSDGPAGALWVLSAARRLAHVGEFTRSGRALRDFLGESQFELRKVVWPTREETLQTTLVIMVVVMILSILLGLIDLIPEVVDARTAAQART